MLVFYFINNSTSERVLNILKEHKKKRFDTYRSPIFDTCAIGEMQILDDFNQLHARREKYNVGGPFQ
jgi:hypothetical protein